MRPGPSATRGGVAVALGPIPHEARAGKGVRLDAADAAGAFGAPPHRASREHQRVNRAAQGIPQATRAGHDLVGDLAERAIALLQHREHAAHRTFASSRSNRTSSGTAAAPSPTIFPSLRSGGGIRARISRPPCPTVVGFVSSGFFFAAMMPFKAGDRKSVV